VVGGDFGVQEEVVFAELLEVPDVVESEAGDASDSGEELEVIVVKGKRVVAAADVDDAENFAGGDEGDAQQGVNLGVGEAGGLAEDGMGSDGAGEHAGAFLDDFLEQRLAERDGVTGAVGAIPGGDGVGVAVVVEEDDGAVGGGHDIENHAEQLPLQSFFVANAADAVGDFEQSVEIVKEAGGWLVGSGQLFGMEVEGVFFAEGSGDADGSRGQIEWRRGGVGIVCGEMEEDKGGIADGDVVLVVKFVVLNGEAVDLGAVATARVADGDVGSGAGEDAVLAGESGIGDAEVIDGLASDGDFAFGQF
jgi:hypothetical protein